MKKFTAIIRLLVVLLLLGFSNGGKEVRFVYDGDTILLENGERVRYLGIDAPEMGYNGRGPEYMAEEALIFNYEKAMERRVRLEYDQEKRDRYGRLLAYVYLDCGRMLNKKLLDQGLAWVMAVPPNLRYLDMMINTQRDAMTRRVGIWQNKALLDDGPFTGNRRSLRFHRPDCPFQQNISSKNRINLDTKRDAFWEGYSPCARCLP